MNLWIKMIFLIGKNKGLTFVELLIALVILSAGIVTVYKSFLLSMDYLQNIETRIKANELIEKKVADLSFVYQISQGQDMQAGVPTETIQVRQRPIRYQYIIEYVPISVPQKLYRLHVTLSWQDRQRQLQIQRTVLLGA